MNSGSSEEGTSGVGRVKPSRRIDLRCGEFMKIWYSSETEGVYSLLIPRKESEVRFWQVSQGTETPSRFKRRTNGMGMFNESVDDMGGIFSDKLARLPRFGPTERKSCTISSGGRKTSMERNRCAWIVSLSVVNLSGEQHGVTRESGVCLERRRNSSARRASHRSMRCQRRLEDKEMRRQDWQTCVHARRCLGFWYPYSQDTQMSNTCSRISGGNEAMGARSLSLHRTEESMRVRRSSPPLRFLNSGMLGQCEKDA